MALATETHKCACCAAEFRGQPWRKYCSRECSNLHRFGHGPKQDAPEGMKICIACKTVKPMEAFHRSSNHDGRKGTCKDCVRHENGSLPKGTFGRCQGQTYRGGRCGNDAVGDSGFCAVHDGRGTRWSRQRVEELRLKKAARELAERGYGQRAIAKALGVGGMKIATIVWVRDGRSSPEAQNEAQAVVNGWREAEEREREEWRREARRMVATGADLSWHLPRAPEPDSDEYRALVAEQERDDFFQQAQPKWVVSLDAPMDHSFNLAGKHENGVPVSLGELLDNPRDNVQHGRGSGSAREEFRDPYEILTGTTEHRMREILGDLDIEDIARLGEHELSVLRSRIREAGLAPPKVQQSERDRLREPEPHRGTAPAPHQGRKSSRHRGRNEASALHKQRGKRFVRRNSKKARDGWGGVVLPEESFT